MLMRQEIEVWEVLPALRRQLAIELVRLGHSQRDIAMRIGVTEAAVSQYLSQKRGKTLSLTKATIQETHKSASLISKGASALSELHRLCNLTDVKKSVCAIHQRQAGVPEDCSLCS